MKRVGYFLRLFFCFSFSCFFMLVIFAKGTDLNKENEECIMCDPASDRAALIALYDATDGPNWTTTWDLGQPMSSWYGVTLNGEGCVIELNLENNQLSGFIPSELGQLSLLTEINLRRNSFSFSFIPPEFGQLTSLTTLNLDHCNIGGTIPEELGLLFNLTTLRLRGNNLINTIPEELGQLNSLMHISLAGNELTGSIPFELGLLQNLTYLDLRFNQLSGLIPRELSQLNNLTSILLNGNQFIGCFYPELSVFCNINYDFTNNPDLPGGGDFDAFCDNGTDECPCSFIDSLALVALFDATDGVNWANSWDLDQPVNSWYGVTLNGNGCVTEIELVLNGLDGNIPSKLRELTSLSRLVLAFNTLSGVIPPELGELNNLTFLEMIGNNLSGTVPLELSQLSSLTHLGLSGNNLNGTIPKELGQLSNLESLHLDFNELSGLIPPELSQLSNLESILLDNNQLSGCFYPELSSFCNITYDFTNNPNLPNGGDFDAFCSSQVGECSCTFRDSLVLVALYEATDGANWTNPWDLNMPISTWGGVFLNEEGCVQGITLWNRNLNGFLPPEIGELASLRSIAISGNSQLSGSLPSTIGELSNLTHLLITGNQINGSIPPELGELDNLDELWLYENQLSGSIPPQLGQLSFLTELELNDNLLEGTIPPELGQLENLRRFKLSDNRLNGTIPAELGQLDNLDYLNFENNYLTGTIPADLRFMDNLVFLILNNNQLEGSIPASLGEISTLGNIQLASNQLSGVIPPELSLISDIDFLDLSNNYLEGTIPQGFENLNFWILNLSQNQLVGSIPDLGNHSNLFYLWLHNNQLSGSIPASLGQLSNLTNLRLENNQLCGCFPPELSNLCNIDYNFAGNPCLPGGGDFLSFCLNQFGACPNWANFTVSISSNSPVCQGEDVLITFNISGEHPPYDIVVNNGTTDIEFNNLIDGDQRIVSLNNTGLVTLVSIEDASGCVKDNLEQAITVIVENPPNAGENNSIIVCDDETRTVNLFSTLGEMPDEGGTWINDTGVAVDISDPTSVSFSGIESGTYGFSYVVDGNICSDASAAVSVIVKTPPNPGDNNTVNICTNGETTINLVTSLGGTPDEGGTWTNDTGVAIDISDPTSVSFLGIESGNYDFSYTISEEGCFDAIAVVTVVVNSAPIVDFVIEDEYCQDAPEVLLVDFSEGGIFTSSTLNLMYNEETGNYSFNPLSQDLGTHSLTYEFTDENGCFNSTTKELQVIPVCDISVDEYGGRFYTNQMIIKLPNYEIPPLYTVPGFESSQLMNTSPCGKFQLWQVAEVRDPNNGSILITIEEKIAAASSESDIEDGGANYVYSTFYNQDLREGMSNNKSRKSLLKKIKTKQTIYSKTNNDIPIKIAILDTGINTNDECLNSYLATNIYCDNSEIQGEKGYNFVNGDNNIFDNVGHGTRLVKRMLNVTGTLNETVECQNTHIGEIEVLVGKIYDGPTGNLWNLIEGLSYSLIEQADIVTIASGYNGSKSSILECLIKDLKDACTLVVTSAGNDALLTDITPHFPSGFAFSSGLDNVISVAATEGYGSNDNELTTYSNYGIFSTNIGYPGFMTSIEMDVETKMDVETNTRGTSVSVAGVSGIAALLKANYPNATYKDISHAIYSSVNIVDGLEVRTGGVANFAEANTLLGEIMNASISCESCICIGCPESMEISNEDMSYPSVFQTLDMITTKYNVPVVVELSDEDITFKAGQEITLNPGFEVELGAEFEAIITNCDVSGFTETTEREESYNFENGNHLQSSSNSLSIFPNPFYNRTTIRYTVTQSDRVSMFVSDLNGKKVAEVVDGISTTKGTHELEFNSGDLSEGLYFLTVVVGDERMTEKLVLIKN